MAKKSEESNKRFAFRITDKGAIQSVVQTMDTLLHISATVNMHRIEGVNELIDHLKNQLKKYLQWLDRIPDGTLYKHGITRKELNHIKKNAKWILGWSKIPSEEHYKQIEKSDKEFERLQQQKETLEENRIGILTDTSFLLSYIIGSDANTPSTRVVVSFLKTQRRFFDFFLPNLVLLEMISKLKQRHSFKKARAEFDRLIEEICEGRVAVNDGKIGVFEIFERYERFSKKKLSSSLRSNDFIIATDGILAKAMILTCDRKMYEGIKKTYQNVFLITKDPKSYLNFINSFEKRKISLLSVQSPASQQVAEK